MVFPNAREPRKVHDAVKVADRARALDPLSPIINLNLGTMQLYGGDYTAADSTLRSAILMDPEISRRIGRTLLS